MVHCEPYPTRMIALTWKDFDRHERKIFYRENESRVRRGLPPLPKDSVKRLYFYNEGY